MTATEGTHFAIIPNKALRDRRLTNGAFRLLGVLSTYLNQKGFCFPSMDKLAFDCNCTKRAIINQMKELQNFGYVVKRHMYNDSEGQTSNIYYVQYDEIPPEGVNVDSLGGERRFTGGSERRFTPGVNVDSPKVYIKEVNSFSQEKNNAQARACVCEDKNQLSDEEIKQWQLIESEMLETFTPAEMSFIRGLEFWKDKNKLIAWGSRFIVEKLYSFNFCNRFAALENVQGLDLDLTINHPILPVDYKLTFDELEEA